MFLWVAYDISSNKNRRKVAIQCKRIGLVRIQKSVFMGRITKTSFRDFKEASAQLISKTDKLYLMPISPNMYKNMLLYGESFDIERISVKTINIVL